MLCVEHGLHIVLIGLGGGGLPMFLRNNIPKVPCIVSYYNITNSIVTYYIYDICRICLIFFTVIYRQRGNNS